MTRFLAAVRPRLSAAVRSRLSAAPRSDLFVAAGRGSISAGRPGLVSAARARLSAMGRSGFSATARSYFSGPAAGGFSGACRPRSDAAKRALDVTVAAAVLVAGAPVAAYLTWRIRREDGGPILYSGTRIGRDGHPFGMLKFRSMTVDAERLGGSSTADDDPRLTAVGRTMRHWKLDELPQFVNVLRGDMSLVGPRPQVAWDVDRYTPAERRLLTVRPGITDWASIVFRNEGEILAGAADPDEAYDRLIRPRKIQLGLAYVDNRTLATDARILVLTALAVTGYRHIDTLLMRSVPATRTRA